MSVELKIKTQHLAAESRIIRTEERKLKRHARAQSNEVRRAKAMGAFHRIQDHRKMHLRPHARSTHLAYGFLKGTPYKAIEGDRTRSEPNWPEIERMALKYSNEDSRKTKQRLAAWQAGK